MNWDDPEFLEAIRLIRKFFPESKAVISDSLGLHWEDFLGAMFKADWGEDSSCDPFCQTTTSSMILASLGGTDGTELEVYDRLIRCAGIRPSGRVVVVPDALGKGGASMEERPPFVCHTNTLRVRLEEIAAREPSRYLFDGATDTLFVYESGHAMLVNHDSRFFWARSRVCGKRAKKIPGK